MEPSTRENLLLVGKSILVIVGGIMAVAALVELIVGGASVRALAYLAVGLLLSCVPIGLAFRDAVKHGRKRGPEKD